MNETLHGLGIDHLSVPESLDLIGLIWDSFVREDQILPLPDWHLRELEQCRASAEAKPDAAIPWETVKSRLKARS